MATKIQFKRGALANLPVLNAGEPAFTTDSNEFFIGNGTNNIELAKTSDLDAINKQLLDITSNLTDMAYQGIGIKSPLKYGGTNLGVNFTVGQPINEQFFSLLLPKIKQFNCHVKTGSAHFVNMSTYSITPKDTGYTALKSSLDGCIALGIIVDMLTLFTQNESDWTLPITITSGKESTYFNNQKTVALDLAKICDDYNIPILCVGNEQPYLSNSQYISYWVAMVNEIKALYPNLKLVYATTSDELIKLTAYKIANIDNINNYMDFIGNNLYYQLTRGNTDPNNPPVTIENVTDFQLKESLFMQWHRSASNSTGYFGDLSNAYKAFGKKILITETGHVNRADFLDTVGTVPVNMATPISYDVQYLHIKTTFDVLGYCDFIEGIFIWIAHGITSPLDTFYWLDNPKLTPYITNFFGGVYNV